MNINPKELPAYLFAYAKAYPDEAGVLISACVEGLQAARGEAVKRAGECGFAMLGAFVLQDEKRVPQDLRETFLTNIAAVIGDGSSPIEKKMVAKANGETP